MLNTDNFTTFLPIFPFQILFKAREKSESFEGFFGGKKIFCKTYARETQSAIRHFSAFAYWLRYFCRNFNQILANKRRQNVVKLYVFNMM